MIAARFTDLSKRQVETLEFLVAYVAAQGVSPSYVEIAAACGIASKNSVSARLHALDARGYIRRLPQRARSIEILARAFDCKPGCNCRACAERRYIEQAQILNSARRHNTPQNLSAVKMVGIKSMSELKKCALFAPQKIGAQQNSLINPKGYA